MSDSPVLLSDEMRRIILKNRFCKPLGFLDGDSADNIRLEFERLPIRSYTTLLYILNKLAGQPCLRLRYRTHDHSQQHEPSIAVFFWCATKRSTASRCESDWKSADPAHSIPSLGLSSVTPWAKRRQGWCRP